MPLILRILLCLPVWCLLKIFCKFEVRGIENIRVHKTRGVIFAANHASELDPVLVNAALPFMGEHNPLFFAADEPKLFSTGFGWRSYIYKAPFFKAFGAYSVYLKKPRLREALKNQVALLQKNRSLLFFPEGGRTRDGELREAKLGIGYLLYKTEAVIIPVGIKGSYGMSVKNFLLGRMRVHIFFGAPITRKDMWGEKTEIRLREFKESADVIMLRVKDLIQ
ncbi:MAG: lysophospholipid acyltransferase family protein [bacterium]|nr:lysophospholipid acyltransferase family protein [bacterium]